MAASLGLLVGAKLLNVQVPFIFKYTGELQGFSRVWGLVPCALGLLVCAKLLKTQAHQVHRLGWG